jgi:hypothetical protein
MMEVSQKLQALDGLTLAQLQKKHLEFYGIETRTKNKAFLRKKLAYRIQELAEGGLSPKAKARIEELAPALRPDRTEAKRRVIRRSEPPVVQVIASLRDPRLPTAGTILRREYGGSVHEVECLPNGFRFRNRIHKSLSAIAKIITGTNWNGFLFFGLIHQGRKA